MGQIKRDPFFQEKKKTLENLPTVDGMLVEV